MLFLNTIGEKLKCGWNRENCKLDGDDDVSSLSRFKKTVLDLFRSERLSPTRCFPVIADSSIWYFESTSEEIKGKIGGGNSIEDFILMIWLLLLRLHYSSLWAINPISKCTFGF